MPVVFNIVVEICFFDYNSHFSCFRMW